jgi:hypothetical protein
MGTPEYPTGYPRVPQGSLGYFVFGFRLNADPKVPACRGR